MAAQIVAAIAVMAMRIIAGRFRRKRLLAAPGQTTRPLTDRAKERLFARLEPLTGERILDLFAGTGTIGLEALSRGAASAVFIERDGKAYSRLRRNVAALEVGEEAFCWRTDIFRCSFRPKGQHERHPYDRIFIDPPYVLAEAIQPGGALFRVLTRVARPAVSSPEAEVILRVPREAELALPDVWNSEPLLRVGGMAIYRLRRRDWASSAAAGTVGEESSRVEPTRGDEAETNSGGQEPAK